jgi:hypothetical protein
MYFLHARHYSIMVHCSLLLELLQHREDSWWDNQGFLFLVLVALLPLALSLIRHRGVIINL